MSGTSAVFCSVWLLDGWFLVSLHNWLLHDSVNVLDLWDFNGFLYFLNGGHLSLHHDWNIGNLFNVLHLRDFHCLLDSLDCGNSPLHCNWYIDVVCGLNSFLHSLKGGQRSLRGDSGFSWVLPGIRLYRARVRLSPVSYCEGETTEDHHSCVRPPPAMLGLCLLIRTSTSQSAVPHASSGF